jgi:hypothetical protein
MVADTIEQEWVHFRTALLWSRAKPLSNGIRHQKGFYNLLRCFGRSMSLSFPSSDGTCVNPEKSYQFLSGQTELLSVAPSFSATDSGVFGREAPNDARAAEVMRQVVAAYHSLSTYGDKGTSIVQL